MFFGICLCSPPSEGVLFWLPSWGSIYEALCCSQPEGSTISQINGWRNSIYISCISIISHVSCIPHSCFLFFWAGKGRCTKREEKLGKYSCPNIAYTQRKVWLWKESSLCYQLDALFFAQYCHCRACPCTANNKQHLWSSPVGGSLTKINFQMVHQFDVRP